MKTKTLLTKNMSYYSLFLLLMCFVKITIAQTNEPPLTFDTPPIIQNGITVTYMVSDDYFPGIDKTIHLLSDNDLIISYSLINSSSISHTLIIPPNSNYDDVSFSLVTAKLEVTGQAPETAYSTDLIIMHTPDEVISDNSNFLTLSPDGGTFTTEIALTKDVLEIPACVTNCLDIITQDNLIHTRQVIPLDNNTAAECKFNLQVDYEPNTSNNDIYDEFIIMSNGIYIFNTNPPESRQSSFEFKRIKVFQPVSAIQNTTGVYTLAYHDPPLALSLDNSSIAHIIEINPLTEIDGHEISISKDWSCIFNNQTIDDIIYEISVIALNADKDILFENFNIYGQTIASSQNIPIKFSELAHFESNKMYVVIQTKNKKAANYTIELKKRNYPPVLTSITADVNGQDFYQVDIDPVYNTDGEVSYEITAQKFCYIVNPLNTEDINLELQFSKPMENVEVTITDEEGHDSNATATNSGDGTWQAALPPLPNETIVTGVQYYLTIVGTDEDGLSLDSKMITQYTNGNFGPVYVFDTETGIEGNTSDNLHRLYIGVNQDYTFLPSATINEPATPCEDNIFVDFIVQRLVGHNINLKAFVWPADLVAQNTASDHPVHWVFNYADGTTEDTYINLEGNVVTWLNYQFQPDKNNGSMELPVEFSYCKRTSDGMSFELYSEDSRVSKTVTLEIPKIADGFHSSIIMNRYNNLTTTFLFDFKNREAYQGHMDEIKWSIEQIEYTISSYRAHYFEGQQHSIKNENAKLIPIKLKITFDDGSVFKTSENIYLCGFNAN